MNGLKEDLRATKPIYYKGNKIGEVPHHSVRPSAREMPFELVWIMGTTLSLPFVRSCWKRLKVWAGKKRTTSVKQERSVQYG